MFRVYLHGLLVVLYLLVMFAKWKINIISFERETEAKRQIDRDRHTNRELVKERSEKD